MPQPKTRNVILGLLAVMIILAAGTYLLRGKFKSSAAKPGNDVAQVAETTPEKVSFAKGAEEHFRKGHQLLREKKLDPALDEFREAARISPNTALTYYWVGMVYYYKGEPEKAMAQFKKTLELEPENYHALAMIGRVLSFDKTKLDEAVNYLKKAISLNPEHYEAHFDLGRIYALKGDMDRALAEFAFIFRGEPRFALYHFEMGRIFEAMKAGDRAKKEYARALQLDPDLKRAKEALDRLK